MIYIFIHLLSERLRLKLDNALKEPLMYVHRSVAVHYFKQITFTV